MDKKVVLVGSKICPFTHRAWLTLKEKHVDFEFHEVSLVDKQPFLIETYKKAYAHDPTAVGKVPVLIDGQVVLAESDLVSWYVAEKFTGGSELIPKDTFQRAKLRHFLNQVPSKIIPAFYGMAGYSKKSPDDQKPCLCKLQTSLALLESHIQGDYILGDNITLADIFVYPWMVRCCVLDCFFGVKIDPKFVKVCKWVENMRQREAVKGTIEPNEVYVEAFKKRFTE